jgi:hypothetical protein
VAYLINQGMRESAFGQTRPCLSIRNLRRLPSAPTIETRDDTTRTVVYACTIRRQYSGCLCGPKHWRKEVFRHFSSRLSANHASGRSSLRQKQLASHSQLAASLPSRSSKVPVDGRIFHRPKLLLTSERINNHPPPNFLHSNQAASGSRPCLW